MAEWFFGGEAGEDRVRHESLEPRILYSASPIDDPDLPANAPQVAEAAPTGGGGEGVGGPAPVTQDNIPEAAAEADLGGLLAQIGSFESGELEQLSSSEAGNHFRLSGSGDWSQLGLTDGEAALPTSISGDAGRDDLFQIDLRAATGALDLFFDGGTGGRDALQISGVNFGSYEAGANAGEGSLVFGNHRIRFSGVEAIVIDGTGLDSGFTFTMAEGANDLTVDSPAEGWSRVRGFANGVAFEDLYFSNVESVILDATLGDTAADGADRVTIASSLVATGLKNFDVLTGEGDDTIVIGTNSLAPPVSGGVVTLDAGAGKDRLIGSGADTLWRVTGFNEGSVYGMQFRGVEDLEGAADNKDHFLFEAGASLSGGIHGGDRGFDTLEMLETDFSRAVFAAEGPDSGWVILDEVSLRYAGLEPILVNAGNANEIVFNLTANDDIAELSSAFAGNLTLTSLNATFELTHFTAPTTSLVINAGGGDDRVTVASSVQLDLSGNFGIVAEEIVVNAGATIAAGNVYLTSRDGDGFPLSLLSLDSKESRIRIDGSLTAVEDIVLDAMVVRDVFTVNPIASVVFGSSTASVIVSDGASLTAGGEIRASAVTSGSIEAWSPIAVTINYDEFATVDFGNAMVAAGGLSITALSATWYEAIGRASINNIAGETRARLNNTQVDLKGDLTLKASDVSSLRSSSPDELFNLADFTNFSIDAAIANNNLDRIVEASVAGARIEADEEGSVTVEALKSTFFSATVGATTISSTAGAPSTEGLQIGVTMASNEMTGGVTAFIADSSVTLSDGGVTVSAEDRTVFDSTTTVGPSSLLDGVDMAERSGNGGLALGFTSAVNAIGYDVPDFLGLNVDALLGTGLGTVETAKVVAYIEDTAVDVSGDVVVQADSSIRMNATVSNVMESVASPGFGSSSNAASMVIATNVVHAGAEAWIRGNGPTATVLTAGGEVRVSANDQIEAYANTKVTSTVITAKDDGGTAVDEEMPRSSTTTHQKEDGRATVNFGETVFVPSEKSDFAVGEGVQEIKQGTRVVIDDPDFDPERGEAGAIYEYLRAGDEIDLGEADYTRPSFWRRIPRPRATCSNTWAPPRSSICGRRITRSAISGRSFPKRISSPWSRKRKT